MNNCCELGEKYSKESLGESSNLFLSPALGPLGIDGYLLLISKEHRIGIGDLQPDHYHELEQFSSHSKGVLSDIYSSPVTIFEHGEIVCAPNTKDKLMGHGGGCIDHAHLHLVPTSINLLEFLDGKFNPEQLKSLGYDGLSDILSNESFSLKKIQAFEEIVDVAQKTPYLFIETQDGERYVVGISGHLPSQFFRQIIASQIGIPHPLYDWALVPEIEQVEKTKEMLKGKF